MISSSRSVALLLVLAAAGCTVPAGQQPGAAAPVSTAPAPAGKPAEPAFALRPYLWAAGISGNGSADSDDGTGIATDFGGLLDHLDGALLLASEARLDDALALLGDFVWLSLEGDETGPGGTTVRSDLDVIEAQLALAYRVARTDGLDVDLLAGLRVISLEMRLASGAIDADRRATLPDPLVGLRGNVRLAADWRLLLYADVGGFGVGTDLSYQLAAIVEYAITDRIAVGLGYRQLGLDVDEEHLEFDGTIGGPLLGFEFRF